MSAARSSAAGAGAVSGARSSSPSEVSGGEGSVATRSPSGSDGDPVSSSLASEAGAAAVEGVEAVLDGPDVAAGAGAALGTAVSWWSCNTVYGYLKCCINTCMWTAG